MIVGWIIAAAVALLVVFGLVDHYEHVFDAEYKSTASKAVYNGCARVGWSLAIAWTMFACTTGNGGEQTSSICFKHIISFGNVASDASIR